jgi:hypothetical protein
MVIDWLNHDQAWLAYELTFGRALVDPVNYRQLGRG